MAEQEAPGGEQDLLILVGERDEPLGFETKAACHDGEGILHRAFSIFLFNGDGKLLLQQRAAGKRLWGLFWSNSCCSHPRKGEGLEEATQRRLGEELGVSAPLERLYSFSYHARFGEAGSERELCHVLVGRSDQPVRADPEEIADWRWVDATELDRELARDPERYTPWMRMEWARLRHDFAAVIDRLAQPAR